MYEHKCKEKPDVYTIFIFEESNITTILENIYNEDEFIENLKFCPWCGANLEDEK